MIKFTISDNVHYEGCLLEMMHVLSSKDGLYVIEDFVIHFYDCDLPEISIGSADKLDDVVEYLQETLRVYRRGWKDGGNTVRESINNILKVRV